MKRFYNNTIMSGALSKALRVLALLCVLLGVSTSAWADFYIWGFNGQDMNCTPSPKAQKMTNNSGAWSYTHSNFNDGNYVFFITTSNSTDQSTAYTQAIMNLSVESGSFDLKQGSYGGKTLYHIWNSNKQEVTITYNTATGKLTATSSSGGGAAACTPSATITGASLSADKKTITLSGSLTTVCSATDTYYGWQYKTSANGNWEGAITGADKNSSIVAIDYSKSWNNGGNLVAGTTYYFRAYATYDAKTWYSDDKILSVTIPKGGGSTGEADCDNIIYLNPGVWEHTDGQRYAAYFFNGTSSDMWVDMVATTSGGECAGLYYVKMPEGGYKNVLFGRMNPDRSDNSFTHKDQGGPMYNQTENCTLTEGKNLYSITGWNDGDDSKSGVGTPTKSDCTDGCIPAEQPSTNVLLSREAIVNKSAKTAQLFGYLKSTNCPESKITDYGFFYCMVNDGDTPCLPSSSSTPIAADPSPALSRGMEFTATVGLIKEPSDALQDGKTYYYRAYAKIDDQYILSGEIRSFSTDPCIPQYGGLSDKYVDGTPIVYTINADPAFVANDCKLHFKSLQAAIEHLKETYTKDDDFKYVTKSGDSYNLNQPVEMRVVYYDDTPLDNTSAYIYRGTTNVGKRAGDAEPKNSNLIEDINRTATNAANTLTIKAGTSIAKPWIHHIVLRNSKNIVLDSLCIYSDPVLYDGKTIGDNAIEMDINHANGSQLWNELNSRTGEGIDAGQHFFSNANILVQNCMIGSDGFTGAHISSYDGVTFKNNDFEIVAGPNMDKNYGASFKLLYCKNVKFIENNFRGDHATLMWIQEVQNMLVMNNVFWNTNKYLIDNEGDQYPAAMRLVTQFTNPIKNVGFFYNTYYFAENNQTAKVPSGYDFLQMTHTISGGSGDINVASIKFQYNNCYSYDSDAHGRTADNYVIKKDNGQDLQTGPFLADVSGDNYCPNNFWSQYDEDIYDDLSDAEKNTYVSKFAFGCADNEFTNVKNQVCETTASGPASLMVKGEDLNNGEKPDITFTGITLTDEEWYSDRYLTAVRPKANEGWTYGAYQSKDEITTQTIYWVGVSSDWDNRNNWEYETEVDGKMVRQRVSCINTLSEDLKVVIEEIGTVEIAGGRKWPQIPASFTENRTNSEHNEHVSAGLGTGKTPTKFASTIELEYGAGLRGVENLNDNGTMRYDKAIVHFDADRDKWLLVGPIVRPFDTEKNDGTTRNVNSGDYFRNYEPQIYMHGTVVDGDDISWGKTFGDLNVDVTPDTVFAINASVWYGKYYDTAEDYLKYEGIKVDDKAPIPYRFTGRFAVEEYKTDDAYKYTLKYGADKIHLINNVYPCNLDAKEIERLGLGTINVYNYNEASFASTSASQASGNVYIKAQNGFVFKPNEGKQLKLTNDILAEGSTRTRAAEIPLPTFSLKVDNANTTKPGASNIVVRYDEFLGESEESLLNTPKVFTRNSDTPEAYIIHNDGKYTRLDAGKEKVTIPLGVRLIKPMNITFEKVYNEGYDEVVLVDTKTQKFYNLLKRTYTTEKLEADTLEGRFYLNLTISGDEDLEEEGDNPGGDDIVDDDDVTTEVEETIEEAEINIYTVDNSLVRVSSVGTALKTIYVSDMTGRTDSYNVDGNYVELQLPVSSGVYTVTVVGETASKVGKVILK